MSISTLSPYNLLLIMTATSFLLGIATFITGIVILATRTSSREVKSLATQTSRLAQKGLAEDVAGLVGNASNLLDAMNQMVRTAAGIGILLTFVGLALIGISCWLAFQIYRMQI